MVHTLILGAFGSGKSLRLLREVEDKDGLLFAPTPALCAHLAEIARAHDINVQPAREARLSQVFPSGATVGIDDADILDASVLQALVDAASTAGARVIATARRSLSGFELIERLSQAKRVPVEHQKLVSILFRSATLDLTPGEVAFVSHQRVCTDASARQAAGRIERALGGEARDAVFLDAGAQCRRFRQAIRETWPGAKIRSAREFYGQSARHIIVLTEGLSTQDFLEAITRSRSRLSVTFNAQSPPQLLARAKHIVAPHISHGGPFVNWEDYACRPARKRRCVQPVADPFKHITPRTITALCAHLAEEARALGIYTTHGAVKHMAERLSWTHVPKIETIFQEGEQLLDTNMSPVQSRVAGMASELILLREIYLLDPPASIILLPECARRYQKAIPCDSVFMNAWAKRPYLRLKKHSAEGWLEVFQPESEWGQDRQRVAKRLSNDAVPHVCVPQAIMRDYCDKINRAIGAYVDDAVPNMSTEDYWTLACLALVTDAGAKDARAFDAPCPLDFTQAAQRARRLSYTRSVRYADAQVCVREAHGFKGFADFVLNNNTVCELKCSRCSAESFTARVSWAMQAAVYAYAKRMEDAIVYNMANNHCYAIRFNKNLFI